MKIEEVGKQKATAIIESRTPLGLFYLKEGEEYTAIDNSTSDAWTESGFITKQQAIDWLMAKPNREKQDRELRVDNSEKIPLTPELLNLIKMVHAYRNFVQTKNNFNDSCGLPRMNRWEEIESFYWKIDEKILSKYNLKKDTESLNRILYYVVTEDMLDTLSSDLPTTYAFF